MKRKRLVYLIALAVVIITGLLSRRFSSIPNTVGDGLWAVAVFCCWRILMPGKSLCFIAILSLFTAFSVEFLQLIQYDWLVNFRSTTFGHLLLGQGFIWTDLLAYLIGVTLIYFIAIPLEDKSRKE